ncbi:MAG: hypothetical protein LBQ51_07430 [Desulfovibrio sp.]|jgi:hypothetical protein|nr:hypothetical protein [Desulfovibrio sp.]
MIRMLTAFTEEIEDPAGAVAEITAQLDLEHRLLRSSAGIIQCYPEFLETGVARAICDALPFDVVGCTSLCTAVPGSAGLFQLTLTVLTGDDATFAAGASESTAESLDGPVDRLYAKLLAALPEKPSMHIIFHPYLLTHSGNDLTAKLSSLAGNAPFFGIRAIDETPDHAAACAIYNGRRLTDSVALLAVAGNADPVFLMKNAATSCILSDNALVTASDGNMLKMVNGIPALDYFRELGFVKNGEILGKEALVFVVDAHDGLPPLCHVYVDTTAEGYVFCGGYIPAGADIRCAVIDPAHVAASAVELAAEALPYSRGKSIMIVSGASRFWALGRNAPAEIESMVKRMGGGPAAYTFAYSGGQIFPTRDAAGRWTNQFHNSTLTMCIL